MPYFQRVQVLQRMKQFVEGVVGQWATDAGTFICDLETKVQFMPNEQFAHQLGQWELLLAQAPPCVLEEYVKG